MMESKKRKYEEENRAFNCDWEEEFFFVERNGKPMCLLCQATLSQYKASNIKRHYETNHNGFSKEFPNDSQLRKAKLKSLKENFHKQSTVMSMFTKEADLTTEAGYLLAFNIAKAKKPYTEGEFVKTNISQVVSILDPENKKLQKLIEQMPASRHTIERRISVISDDIMSNLQQKLSNCSAMSLALDESTDIKDKPQLAIFVRYVSDDLEVVEELLDLVTLKDTTRGCDIKEALDGVLAKHSVPINKIVSVATDGAPSMTGKNRGLIGILNVDKSFPNFLPVHCVIHREHLAAKHFEYPQVMQIVLKVVNYIRSSAKTHRQFKSFVEEMDNEELPDDVPWHCLVRWLSVGNVLGTFFQLLDPIKQFLLEKGISYPQLEDPQWLLDLSFFTDIVQHLQTLNLSLQGKGKLVSDLAQNVFSFYNKLRLFQKDLETKTYAHFKCLKIISDSLPDEDVKTEEYVCKISRLAEEINNRFSDLRTLKRSFLFLENPFAIDVVGDGCPVAPPIVTDTAAVELELLELHEDEGLKGLKINGCSTIEFWKNVPQGKYPKTKECAKRLISIFGTTYTCESLYSTLKFVKSKHRAELSDEHLSELVRTALTNYQPDFKKLTDKMNTRKSTSQN